MRRSHHHGFVLLAALASLGASYRTAHFVVEAPDERIAQKIGECAEVCRKQIALKWLGEEMPAWQKPCPIKVTVTMGDSNGATVFAFDSGRVLIMRMHLEGRLNRILDSALPHEVAHTVLASHFRKPIPRWADEGGASLSEDGQQHRVLDQQVGKILETPGRAMPMRRLLSLTDYPRDLMALYAQGYSLTRFLVEKHNRRTFLAFVADGMDDDWDNACEKHYGFKNVEQMESAWVKWVRTARRKHEHEVSRQRLEKEMELLRLENQLLKSQLQQARQAAQSRQEQNRLKAKIRQTRRALKKLPEAASSPSTSTPAKPLPARPALVPYVAPPSSR